MILWRGFAFALNWWAVEILVICWNCFFDPRRRSCVLKEEWNGGEPAIEGTDVRRVT